MKWTSIVAYGSIYDSLPQRRQEVLKYLLEYVKDIGCNPTAQELVVYSARKGYAYATSLWKRLTELSDEHSAIHRGATSRCSVTLHTAYTWIPGPEKEEDFGKRVKGRRIAARLNFLLSIIPEVNAQSTAYILGVKIATIIDLPEWKYRSKK